MDVFMINLFIYNLHIHLKGENMLSINNHIIYTPMKIHELIMNEFIIFVTMMYIADANIGIQYMINEPV